MRVMSKPFAVVMRYGKDLADHLAATLEAASAACEVVVIISAETLMVQSCGPLVLGGEAPGNSRVTHPSCSFPMLCG